MTITKTIRFNRFNQDFDCWLNENYIGSFPTKWEAQAELDRLALDLLQRGTR